MNIGVCLSKVFQLTFLIFLVLRGLLRNVSFNILLQIKRLALTTQVDLPSNLCRDQQNILGKVEFAVTEESFCKLFRVIIGVGQIPGK